MTPLEELRAEHLAKLQENKDRADGDGVLARLALATNTSGAFTEWLQEEGRRNSCTNDIASALCTYLGNVIFNFGMSHPDAPLQMIDGVVRGIHQVLGSYLTGDRAAVGVRMDGDHQREVTVAGMVSELRRNGGRFK